MGIPDDERERLTEVFYSQLAEYVPPRRSHHKRPTGDALTTINLRHDARLESNPWFKLALEYGER